MIEEDAWFEAERAKEAQPHPSIACPECDDVPNECCPLCAGSDQCCPICDCPAHECEWREGQEEDYR